MNETELTAEQEQRLAERQARQNRELTRDEVLRRNSVERIKHDKPPAALAGEFARLASTPYVAVPEEDILRLQWHGLYHDKPKVGSFMMRVKAPNGILKSAQLRAVGELAVRQGNNQVEITTRQDLQLHGIRLETMQAAFATLQQAGLSTRAGCGDTLRNITGCPVAGLDAEQLFDVTPLVLEAHRRFSGNPRYDNLPRKHKWTIAACPYHCNAPEIHDVALVGTRQDGRPGFAVWVGGGMSSAPRLARNLGVFVTQAEALDVPQALLDEWSGDLRYRASRSKARFKFMVDDLGPHGLGDPRPHRGHRPAAPRDLRNHGSLARQARNLEPPHLGRIALCQIRAQQIPALASAHLPQFVLARRPAPFPDPLLASLLGPWHVRHLHFHQRPDPSGRLLRRPQFHQQGRVAGPLRVQLLEPRPERLEFAPPHRPFLAHLGVTVHQHVELLFLREQFDLHARPGLLPGQLQPGRFQRTQASLGRAHQILHHRITGSHLRQHLRGRNPRVPGLQFKWLERTGARESRF